MLVRYRILSGKTDGTLSGVVSRDIRQNSLFDDGGLTAAANTPQVVSALEATASLEDVRKLVLYGEIKLRDLVDVGAGWETVEDCVLFDEACAPHRHRADRQRVMFRGAAFMGLAGGLAAFFYWITHIGGR